MEEIFEKMGISQNTIKHMEEMCPNIKELTRLEILQKIELLQKLGCDKTQIVNIISSNAVYLDRSDNDLANLIKKMKELGFDTLNLLFDANPYILNLDDFEIEEYVKKRQKNGEKLVDIVDDMSSNPFLFSEEII